MHLRTEAEPGQHHRNPGGGLVRVYQLPLGEHFEQLGDEILAVLVHTVAALLAYRSLSLASRDSRTVSLLVTITSDPYLWALITLHFSLRIFFSSRDLANIDLNHIMTNLINIIILSEKTVPNTRHRQRRSDRAIVEQHDRQDSSARSASMTAAAIAMMSVSIMRRKI